MKEISVRLTLEEIKALITLTDNQLFRAKFIDPKMPGYKVRRVEFEAGQSGLQKLRNSVVAAPAEAPAGTMVRQFNLASQTKKA